MVEIIGGVDFVTIGKPERLTLDEVKERILEHSKCAEISILEFKDDTFKHEDGIYYIHAETNKGPAWIRVKEEKQ